MRVEERMICIDDFLKEHRQGILYVICGGFTTLVSWVSYSVFVLLGLELNICNILSWICGVAFAFVVNKLIVFESKSIEHKVVIRESSLFTIFRLITGIIAWVLFPILLAIGLDQSLFGIDGLIARGIVSFIEIVLNWVFSKYVIFR